MDELIRKQDAIDSVNRALDRETLLNRLVRKVAIDAIRIVPPVQSDVPDMNVGDMEPVDVSKTETGRCWLERNKDRILQAGLEGREVEFRIGGRLFAIREKAQ